MPTLLGRRCGRPQAAVGGLEKAVGAVILLLLAGIVTAFVVDITRRHEPFFDWPEPATAATFADVELPGWLPPERIERFGAGSLYEKIDGRAEMYVPLGVVELKFGTYARGDDASRTVDVYWYTMGTPDGARRVYEVEKPTDTADVPVGDAAYESGGAVFFRKGANYVQVLPAQAEDADVARRIAERLAAAM